MLYIHPRREPAKKAVQAAPNHSTSLPDHWSGTETEESTEGNNWLLSYADVITLLFALFVMLCAHQKIMLDRSAKPDRLADKTGVESVAKPAPPVEILPEPVRVAQVDAMPTPLPAPAPLPVQPQWLAVSEPEPALPLSPPAPMTARLSQAELDHWVEFSASPEKVRLEVNDKILFDPASAKLKPEGILILDSLAQWLKTHAGQIDVEGHTDNSPISNTRFGSNWELSSARASAVTRYLISKGLPPERIKAIGLADTQPRNDNESPDSRARNRRVSLVLYLLKQEGVKI
jgi:chemotaxis protein MotB